MNRSRRNFASMMALMPHIYSHDFISDCLLFCEPITTVLWPLTILYRLSEPVAPSLGEFQWGNTVRWHLRLHILRVGFLVPRWQLLREGRQTARQVEKTTHEFEVADLALMRESIVRVIHVVHSSLCRNYISDSTAAQVSAAVEWSRRSVLEVLIRWMMMMRILVLFPVKQDSLFCVTEMLQWPHCVSRDRHLLGLLWLLSWFS